MSLPRSKARPATYEDLCRLQDNLVGEIVGGELFASPRPALPHAYASTTLGMGLGGPFHVGSGGPGGWIILFEPEVHLGPDVLVPDLAGWRRERVPVLPDAAAFELAPDWICEVLSPSTAQLDRIKKMPRYAASGVGHAWLVDPLAQTLEVFRLDRARSLWTVLSTHEGDERPRAEPFDAIELDLSLLWAPSAAKATKDGEGEGSKDEASDASSAPSEGQT